MDPIRPKDRIQTLEENLYSREKVPSYTDTRTGVKESEEEVRISQTWDTGGEDDIRTLVDKEKNKREGNQSKLFKKILLFSASFFVIALLVALFMFFGGRNSVSANNIDIQVVGPTMSAGGEVLSLDAVIKNKNRVPLTNVILVVSYPPGSRSPQNVNNELVRSRDVIQDVPARGETRKTISAILFGEKDSVQEIVMTLEYQLEGSTATFTKEKRYEIAIKSSPVIVSISNPSEINANQEFEFLVDISANSSETLRGVLFKAEYPFGFIFKEATPSPAGGTDVWSIGDLPPTEKRQIKIKGTLQGQNDEERTFRFSTGIVSAENEEDLGAIFSNLAASIKIRRPFLSLDVMLGNKNTETVAASPGARVQTNITWTNNLPSELLDSVVEVKLEGDILDKTSVTASTGGFYRSIDNTVVWDKNSRKNQSNLAPGQSDSVSLGFASVKNLQPIVGSKKIDVTITVTGNQITDSGKQERITTVEKRSVLLASSVTLNAVSVRSIGTIENFGPIPPRADQEVSYTAIWSISNTFNTVTGGVVTATLPNYVTWRGFTSPSNELISYDPLNRVITWNVGDVTAATGAASQKREVHFQVSFIPSISQVGDAPVLVQSATFTGKDRFTGEQIRVTTPSINTRFSTDPTYRVRDDLVAN